MHDLFPDIEPYARGMLAVSEGNAVYWETCGSPRGKPALVVHGGPGIGCTARMRRAFDPARYRIVLFDQRGCGRSSPHASELGTDMSANTTHRLLDDMEKLRVHLGIDRWLLSGSSWGTALALAYAEEFPDRVSELVLTSVTLSAKARSIGSMRGSHASFLKSGNGFSRELPSLNDTTSSLHTRV